MREIGNGLMGQINDGWMDGWIGARARRRMKDR